MSNFFEDKGYSEYFEKLENKLSSDPVKEHPAPVPEPSAVRASVPKHARKKRKKKGLYKTFRLRLFPVIAVLAVLAVVTGTAIACIHSFGASDKSPSLASSAGADTSAQAEKKDVKKPVTGFSADSTTVPVPLANDAKTAVVIRLSDGKILAERNMHTKAYPASTTKIMTLLVAAEQIKDLNKTFTMTYEITDPLYVKEASVAGFLNGEVVSATDLFYGTILPSGADAAVGLAITAAGSESAFVELMNQKVQELNLTDTHFDNVSGLYSKDNYSSSYDLAVILKAAMENDFCKKVLSTYQYTTAKTPQNPNGILLTSTLFSYMYGTEPETAVILGGKTGFVNEAGYCIASFGTNKSGTEEYLAVTMGNSSKWPAFYGQIDLYKQFAK